MPGVWWGTHLQGWDGRYCLIGGSLQSTLTDLRASSLFTGLKTLYLIARRFRAGSAHTTKIRYLCKFLVYAEPEFWNVITHWSLEQVPRFCLPDLCIKQSYSRKLLFGTFGEEPNSPPHVHCRFQLVISILFDIFDSTVFDISEISTGFSCCLLCIQVDALASVRAGSTSACVSYAKNLSGAPSIVSTPVSSCSSLT